MHKIERTNDKKNMKWKEKEKNTVYGTVLGSYI